MNLKKITQTMAQRRRHHQVMRAARSAVLMSGSRTPRPSEVAALVFGRFQLRLSEQEAVEFLNAVLADMGMEPYIERGAEQ